MKPDLLEQATSALRSSMNGKKPGEPDLSFLEQAQPARPSLFRWSGFKMPLAILALGSSAWAAVEPAARDTLREFAAHLLDRPELHPGAKQGMQAPRTVEGKELAPASSSQSQALPVPPQKEEASAVPAPAGTANLAAAEPRGTTEEPRFEPARPSRPDPKGAPPRPSESAASPAPEEGRPSLRNPSGSATASSERPLEVYERARRALTIEHNYAAALRGFETYLAFGVSGALAPEAAFYRGVCLLRLGKRAEGRAALTPFARGDFGEYRKREAQSLLSSAQ